MNASDSSSRAPKGDPRGARADVRKVTPYPISILIGVVNTPEPVRAKILKLTQVGMIVDPQEAFFHVGDEHKVDFDIPVIGQQVAVTVKVIKTHDRFDVNKDKKVKLVEMHFKDLPRDKKNAIAQFIQAVGQK